MYKINTKAWKALVKAIAKDPTMAAWSAERFVPSDESSILWQFRYSAAAKSLAELRARLDGTKKPAYVQEEKLPRMREVLADIDAGRTTLDAVAERSKQADLRNSDMMHLRGPRPIFSKDEFKGGAISAISWLYALRAHSRGKVHFHKKTLEQQGEWLEKAIKAAPKMFDGLLLTPADEAGEEWNRAAE